MTKKPKGPNPLAQLASTIETEIIPRLLAAHAMDRPAAPGAPARFPESPTPLGAQQHPGGGATGFHDLPGPGAAEIAAFTRLVLRHEGSAAIAYAEALQDRGVPVDTILLELLAPTARLLGDLWSADLADFSQVTVASGRLQEVLHALCPGAEGNLGLGEARQRAILAPAPGEQHTLGVALVAQFLRQGGWEVVGGATMTADTVDQLVQEQWFAVAGLSLSCERQLDNLATEIAAVRRRSRNPHLAVMVGGALFRDRPDLVALVGADAMAQDARTAADTAGALLGRQRPN